MKKVLYGAALFLIAILLLFVFTGLASCVGPVTPDFSNIIEKTSAELDAFKYQGPGFGSVSSYYLFIDGKLEPINVWTEYIEFIYSPDIELPRAEIVREGAYGLYKAKVYFKDKEQKLKYAR